ncbi:Gti1/Pac2 family-domain-containing protein [Lanmaoa asiatica]|nr:Gti1/Pac2 family-domain-containing protein [Lanmaoa asiatica]
MQHPSLQNVRIRSTRDALHVFYAVARNIIPLITRRLDAEERRAIVPGNVYVWEERSANSEATGLGMERWTDGMGWGPSRVRDDFLFYHQKECDVSDDPTSASTPWAQMISVRVSLPDDRSRGIFRKWHLTAYFSQQKLDRLNTVDNIHGIGDIPVPDGWFRSARRDGKSRREDDLPKSVVAKRISQAPMEGVISTSDAVSLQPSFYQSQAPASVYAQFPTSANASQLELSEPSGSRKNTFSLPSSADHHYSSSSVRDHSRLRECLAGPTSLNCPSPLSSSSSLPTTPSPRISPIQLSERLVPLDYLQHLSYPRRDPIDEQFLQRFSTLTSSTLKGTTTGYSPLRSFSGRMKL